MNENKWAVWGQIICYIGLVGAILGLIGGRAEISALTGIGNLSSMLAFPVAICTFVSRQAKPKGWQGWLLYIWLTGLMLILAPLTFLYGAFWGFPAVQKGTQTKLEIKLAEICKALKQQWENFKEGFNKGRYKAVQKAGGCCESCNYYSPDGTCRKKKEAVKKDFLCSSWISKEYVKDLKQMVKDNINQ